MSTYIGIVGPTTISVNAVLSIGNILRQPEDSSPRFTQATKGYEGRQLHINRFLDETDHSHILLLDHDMIFPEDTLERLRAHEVDFVSGYYLRRRIAPMVSVWYEEFDGNYPMMPYMNLPPKDQLVPLGGSGWGCSLMSRKMLEDIRENHLHGQWEICEVPMNVWPDGSSCRPGNLNPIGSDLRFPMIALRAGYQLWGDANVAPTHEITYQLSLSDIEQTPAEILQKWRTMVEADVEKLRLKENQNGEMFSMYETI